MKVISKIGFVEIFVAQMAEMDGFVGYLSGQRYLQ